MNVDRGAFVARASAAGAESRPARSGSQPDAPPFKLDVPQDSGPQAGSTDRRETAREMRDARPSTPSDPPRRPVERTRGATEAPRDSGTSPANSDSAPEPATSRSADAGDRPNGAARAAREARGGNDTRDAAAAESEPTSGVATDAGAPTRAAKPLPDTDSPGLPDRMLALLGVAWTAPAAATAGGVAGVPLAPGDGATAAAALPGSPLPAAGLTAPLGATGTPTATATTAGALPLSALPLAATGNASVAPAEDTPFAALAALVDGAGDRDRSLGASSDAAVSADTPFAGLALRSSEGVAAPTRTVSIAMPSAGPLVLDADFDDGLGSRITWMAEQRLGHAEIRVSPEGLGAIDVRLQMDGTRVHAQFHAANADVRQALESGMERLRDLLGRQGMELGQAQVGSGARQGGEGRPPATAGPRAAGDAGGEPQVTTVRLLRGRGLLDEYA